MALYIQLKTLHGVNFPEAYERSESYRKALEPHKETIE
jgi:hypothetical protein